MKILFFSLLTLFSYTQASAKIENGIYKCEAKDNDGAISLSLNVTPKTFLVKLPQGVKKFFFSDERQESELPGTYLARRFKAAVLVEYEVQLSDYELNMATIILNQTTENLHFLWDIKILDNKNYIDLRIYTYKGLCNFIN